MPGKFKEVVIDDAGWGDLILGVVIGALELQDRRYMERRIPISSFQPPNFERKRYLDDAVKIVEEVVACMHCHNQTGVRKRRPKNSSVLQMRLPKNH